MEHPLSSDNHFPLECCFIYVPVQICMFPSIFSFLVFFPNQYGRVASFTTSVSSGYWIHKFSTISSKGLMYLEVSRSVFYRSFFVCKTGSAKWASPLQCWSHGVQPLLLSCVATFEIRGRKARWFHLPLTRALLLLHNSENVNMKTTSMKVVNLYRWCRLSSINKVIKLLDRFRFKNCRPEGLRS